MDDLINVSDKMGVQVGKTNASSADSVKTTTTVLLTLPVNLVTGSIFPVAQAEKSATPAPKPAPVITKAPAYKRTLVLYHDNCTDGWCSAYLLKKQFPSAELIPASYGTVPDLVLDKETNLLIVDFSFKSSVLLDWKSRVGNIAVLDHHKTAEAELKGLDFCTFDMNESGASLTSKYLKSLDPKYVEPWFVSYVKDRDLWLWTLPESRAINAFIRSFETSIEDWDALVKVDTSTAKTGGLSILRSQAQMIKIIMKNGIEANYEGHKILAVNSSTLQSEIGERACKELGYVFAVIYYADNDNKVNVSLRATDFDVSREAKRYGGGGHRLAAGCQLNNFDDLKREFLRC